jgi:hypothetical protein
VISAIPGMRTVFCIAEDRAGAEIGIKLALLSLARHCPGASTVVYRPASAPGFPEWVAGLGGVRLEERPLPGAEGWNCKPHALLATLENEGEDTQVVWVDSDLVVTSDLTALLASEDPQRLVVTEEPWSAAHQGSEVRTRGWGLPVGRRLGRSLNSCVVRVTRSHVPLLIRWKEMLSDPEYVRRAKESVETKPPHLWSDQDVLSALLGSTEFAGTPLRMLRHGVEILHTGGGLAFSLGERLGGIFKPLPVVLHAIGVKPWVLLGGRREPGWFAWFRRLMQETSQYVVHVRRYRGAVGEPMDWCDRRTGPGLAINALSFGNWALRGLPVTVVCRLIRRRGAG